jgi:predicted exporter
LAQSPWEADIANLSPVSLERKALDRKLRTEIGAPDVHTLLVVFANSAERTLQQSERVVAMLENLMGQKVVDGFDAPSRYLPSKATQQQRQATLPTEVVLRRGLQEVLPQLPFQEGLFEPFVADMVAARTRPLLGPEEFNGTALGLRIGSLLFQRGAESWVALLPLQGVADEAAVLSGVSQLQGVDAHYLDLKALSSRFVNRYRDEALALLAWGAGGIVLVLLWGLHSVVVVLRVLLPVVAAVIGVTLVLLALGERLSLFHLVALLLVAGVGLDYGLFFNRSCHDAAEREQTARALLVCGVTTVLVFGVLAFSQTPVLSAIGTTTAVGAIMCLLFAAILSSFPDARYDTMEPRALR